MEYFKSGFKSVLGAQTGSQTQSDSEIIERLVDRVKTSTLLDDRRDACRALKSLSKKLRLEVGTRAMDVLLNVLQTDRSDAEIVGLALDALSFVISGSPDDDFSESNKDIKAREELGEQFTEIYIKRPENVSLLLELLEEFEFQIRWPAVKLLTGLLIHRPREVQECILASPMGVSRLMDLLSESREVIRNDTLLLLGHLTKGNANIQKIVAFENAFDRLLAIMAEEGYSDGGVVVEDCLVVLLNLLKNNASNQSFFKEGSYIQKLSPFFDLGFQQEGGATGDKGWNPQKLACIHLMLQVLRTLVSPNNPYQIMTACQKIMNQCGLLEQLCTILLTPGVPANVLTEVINTVAEIIRGHHHNQEYFASIAAHTDPPKPAIVVLLMSMVNEKQPFVLRCAVLYCFQSFLYRNELGQAQMVQTLLPSTADMGTQVTAGQILCAGLFGGDPGGITMGVNAWCAAVALSHALVDNQTQKEQLLRVQLATGSGQTPVGLLAHCAALLQAPGQRLHTRLGLLILLCTWLAHCPAAVARFLAPPATNIPFLTSQVTLSEGDDNESLVQGLCAFLLGICIEFNDDSQPSFTRVDLCQLVEKRVGIDTFVEKLSLVSKHESYGKVVQSPQMRYRQPGELLLDHEFAKLFRALEGTIIKAVKPQPLTNGPMDDHLSPEQQSHLQQYKDLIREQDQKIVSLEEELRKKSEELDKRNAECQEMSLSLQQLRDQVALLRAKDACSDQQNNFNQEISSLRQHLEELKQEKENLEKQLLLQSQQLDKMHSEQQQHLQEQQQHPSVSTQASFAESESNATNEEVAALRQKIAQYELAEQLRQQSQQHQDPFFALGFPHQPSDSSPIASGGSNHEEMEKLKKKVEELEIELARHRQAKEDFKKEQEDLLVMLTDQDHLISKYKKRLAELGEAVQDDDDDDYGEEEEEEEDENIINDVYTH